jgi:probable rRNA maturation factor
MLEVEVFGAEIVSDAPPYGEVLRLCAAAAAAAGIGEGHVAIEYVDARRIAQLNAEHRKLESPTDVLSFPIDGVEPLDAGQRIAGQGIAGQGIADGRGAAPERELGDIVICPEHTADLREAIVHGMLHLLGMDHETDNGEMLALQHELLERAAR